MTFTYTRQTHDPDKVGHYKLKYVSKRLVELSIASRNLSEETKDLADLLQHYYQARSIRQMNRDAAARANVTATPKKTNGSTNPTGGAYMAGKQAGRQEASTAEPDSLTELKHLIVRWLLNAPADSCEDIAPLIPAPVSMVKRVRTQLVEAGKLRSLVEGPAQEVSHG